MNDPERTPREAGPPLATARLTTTASQLGLALPPVDLRLKLVRSAPESSLYLQPIAPCAAPLLHEWIAPWSPLRIEFGSRHVMRADFDPLPAPWSTNFADVQLDMLTMRADGAATLTLTAKHSALAAFVRRLPTETLIQHVTNLPQEISLLTPAQETALRAAVAAGYYRIPRPINLHKLAAEIGISAASLSERLRRAEGRVIERYVALGAATPLDARTIFALHHTHESAQEIEDVLRSPSGVQR